MFFSDICLLLQMTVREKVEHEIGCHLSSWQRLPNGVCSDCFHIVNEIDVLEHRLDMYRTFLRANVHASITNSRNDATINIKTMIDDKQLPANNMSSNNLTVQSSITPSDRNNKNNALVLPQSNVEIVQSEQSHTSSIKSNVFAEDSLTPIFKVSQHPSLSNQETDSSKHLSCDSLQEQLQPALSSPSKLPRPPPPQIIPIPLTSKAENSPAPSYEIPFSCSSVNKSAYSIAVDPPKTPPMPLYTAPLAQNILSPTSPSVYPQNSPRFIPLSPLHSYPILYAPLPNFSSEYTVSYFSFCLSSKFTSFYPPLSSSFLSYTICPFTKLYAIPFITCQPLQPASAVQSLSLFIFNSII